MIPAAEQINRHKHVSSGVTSTELHSPFADQSGVTSPAPDASTFESTNILGFPSALIAEQLTKIETVSRARDQVQVIPLEGGIFLQAKVSICSLLPGAVCPSGPVPLPGLALVPEGQEREGGPVLVRLGHRTSVQQAGQRGAGVLPLSHEAAQPAASTPAGEVDRRGGGQPANIRGRSSEKAPFDAL